MVDPPPRFVIESTARCNNRCFYCPTGVGLTKHRPELMPWKLFSKIADEIQDFVTHVYIEFLGEPTLHPDLGRMIDRIQEFATVDLATNATLIDKDLAEMVAQCDAISVTICGLRENYEHIHGADHYEDALHGLRLLLKAAPGRVNWTWMALRDNDHQVDEAQQIAESMGVARFGVKGISLGPWQRDLASPRPEWNRYEGATLKRDRRGCREFWNVGYACTDGSVPTCGFDYHPLYPAGDLYQNTFLEIWNGDQYNAMRQQSLAGDVPKMCRWFCGGGPRRSRAL